jgi:methionyl-tRNA synthetase
MWSKLKERGFIYKGEYSGWYSANDECFLSDEQVHDSPDGSGVKLSLESGHPVEYSQEASYMFRLSEFREKLQASKLCFVSSLRF